MNTINSEFVMIMISIIALFLTILAGFGGIGTFLWNQFSKIHNILNEIKLEYVQKQDCEKNRRQCDCVDKMKSFDEEFKKLKDDFYEVKFFVEALKNKK